MTQLIQITRKDLKPQQEWAEGTVFNLIRAEGGGSEGTRHYYAKPYGTEHEGLVFDTEAKIIACEDLKGATVSPVDGRWQDWPQGEYTVLHADCMGVRVKHPVRGTEGLFLYSLFKVVKPQPKPEFELSKAQLGFPLKFRSGCPVKFIAYVPDAKPHCQLVLLNPGTGNIVTRYANGRADDEPQEHQNPGDILINRSKQ